MDVENLSFTVMVLQATPSALSSDQSLNLTLCTNNIEGTAMSFFNVVINKQK